MPSHPLSAPTLPTLASTTTPFSPHKATAQLSEDILLAILIKLAQPEVASCARVSRLLYLLAIPLIYKSLYIDLDEDVNPLFTKPTTVKSGRFQGLGPKINGALAKMRMRGKAVEQGKEKKKGMELSGKSKTTAKAMAQATASQAAALVPVIPLEPLPNRFSFTTHLTLTSHSHSTCASLPSLIMPLLQHLRIRPGFQQNHLDFCQCRHFTEETGRCTSIPACVCPLMSQLRPRRLLIGDDTTGLTGSAMGLTTSDTPFPGESVKELVVFVGSCTGLEIGPEAEHSWLDKIPATVEKLSVIMQPREGLWAQDGRWRFRRVAGFEDGLFDAELLWKKLGMALSGNAGVLEVVGVETIDRDWTELSVTDEEEEIRAAVKLKLASKGWTEKEAEKRAEGISFITRREHDEREQSRTVV